MSSWYLYIQDENKLSQMGGIEYQHDALNVPLSTPKNPLDSLYSGSTNDIVYQVGVSPNSGRLPDILPSSHRLQSYPTICVSARGGVFYCLLPLFNPFYYIFSAPHELQSLPMRHLYLSAPAAHPVFITHRNVWQFVHFSFGRLADSKVFTASFTSSFIIQPFPL